VESVPETIKWQPVNVIALHRFAALSGFASSVSQSATVFEFVSVSAHRQQAKFIDFDIILWRHWRSSVRFGWCWILHFIFAASYGNHFSILMVQMSPFPVACFHELWPTNRFTKCIPSIMRYVSEIAGCKVGANAREFVQQHLKPSRTNIIYSFWPTFISAPFYEPPTAMTTTSATYAFRYPVFEGYTRLRSFGPANGLLKTNDILKLYHCN